MVFMAFIIAFGLNHFFPEMEFEPNHLIAYMALYTACQIRTETT